MTAQARLFAPRAPLADRRLAGSWALGMRTLVMVYCKTLQACGVKYKLYTILYTILLYTILLLYSSAISTSSNRRNQLSYQAVLLEKGG